MKIQPPHKVPEAFIKSNDLVANELLIKIYKQLKGKKEGLLTTEEKEWLAEIETVYLDSREHLENQLEGLIKQAREILDKKEKWNVEEEKLYEILEEIILLRTGEDKVQLFFDQLDDLVTSAMQLDFSKKAPKADFTKGRSNILNYMSLSIEMIVTKLSNAIISQKVADTILRNFSGSIFIVTDDEGNIRYTSGQARAILSVDPDTLTGKPIFSYFAQADVIKDAIKSTNQGDTTSFQVAFGLKKKKSFRLSIMKCEGDLVGEIDEWVFCLSHPTGDSKDIDLTRLSHDYLAPLNTIEGLVNMIHEKQKDVDQCIAAIIQTKNKLADRTKNTLLHIGDENRIKIQKINFESLTKDVLKTLSHVIGFSDIRFNLDIRCYQPFYSNIALIESVIQNLVDNAIKYRDTETSSPFINISICDNEQGVELIIADNGKGIPDKIVRWFNREEDQGNRHEGFGLSIVRDNIDRLGGDAQIMSSEKLKTVFRITLPTR